jgi:hypothetical protein
VSEEELGERLRKLFAASEPVPASLIQAANEAISWRDPDGELARLAAEPASEPSHLRGGQPRLMTFRSGGVVVDLEVSAEDGSVRLLGELDPPRAAGITAEWPGGRLTMQADGHGRFAAQGLPKGWIRLVIDIGPAPGGPVVTEWFRG